MSLSRNLDRLYRNLDYLSSLSDREYYHVMYQTLAEWLIEQRERRGWTQAMLADKAGLRRSDINAIEHGRVTLPGAQKRRAIAKALGVSHEVLLVAAGELTPEEISRVTEPRRYSPESGHEAVLAVIADMTDEEARALADAGAILLRLRRAQTVTHREVERVPSVVG